MEEIGKAYAFFDCDASKEQIDREMPQIRDDARTPKGLQLLLSEGISGLQLDAPLSEALQYPDDYRVFSSEQMRLVATVEQVPLSRMKYAIEAKYEGASNEDVANELGDMLNIVHQRFNTNQGYFRGAVTYEKDGEYHLRE